MEPSELSIPGRKFFKMIEFDDDERLLGEIRKHPFGLFVIIFTGALITLAVMVALMIAPLLITQESATSLIDIASIRTILVGIGFVLSILAISMTAIAAYLYQGNIVIVTNEKITQLLHITVFKRKISQLSVGNVEDVTVTQDGFFARIFNYGTLIVETAGEQQNYTFTYTPHPYDSAKLIVGAHEESIKHFGN